MIAAAEPLCGEAKAKTEGGEMVPRTQRRHRVQTHDFKIVNKCWRLKTPRSSTKRSRAGANVIKSASEAFSTKTTQNRLHHRDGSRHNLAECKQLENYCGTSVQEGIPCCAEAPWGRKGNFRTHMVLMLGGRANLSELM